MNAFTRLTIGALVICCLAGIVGWVMNIVTLAESIFDPLTGLVILRIVGVFVAPLGSVLGLFF